MFGEVTEEQDDGDSKPRPKPTKAESKAKKVKQQPRGKQSGDSAGVGPADMQT